MSMYWAQNPPDFGCLNAAMLRAWNVLYRKPTSDGSCSMHTDCSLQNRARDVLSTHPVTHQGGRQPSPATPVRAAKSGARTKATRVIQLIGNFIATSVSTFQRTTWDGSRAEPENSP